MISPAVGKRKICMLGSPGCGKSTLYRSLWTVPELKNGYQTVDGARKEIFRNLSRISGSFSIKSRLTGTLLSRSNGGLAEWFTRCFSRETLLEMQERYALLIDANYRGLVREVPDPVRRAAVFGFFMKMVNEDILFSEYSGSRPVILDDSVWQSFRGMPEFRKNGKIPDDFPFPSAVIHCTAGTELVMSRIMDRKNQGKLNTLHGGMDEKALKAVTSADIASAKLKSDYLAKKGIPVLTLDMNTSLDDRLLKIVDFLTGESV